VYPGFLTLGTGNPISTGSFVELVNNTRAYAYARNMGICWLQECEDCPTTAQVLPGGGKYRSPALDRAPWYDENNTDTWGFLGVIGLDVQGDVSATRSVTVQNAVTYGGVLGPPYFGPRTLVVRCLAVAVDDCALAAGLEWLNFFASTPTQPCIGDSLTFFDCCPCMCEDPDPMGTCWPATYGELAPPGPPCKENWWLSTYADLVAGPPLAVEQWCWWPRIYEQLSAGPPPWSCCADACVVPYLRQYYNVMVTSGPNVLQAPAMYTQGALAEFELTLVAADPAKHALPGAAASTTTFGGVVVSTATEPVPVPDDPFAVPGQTRLQDLANVLTRPAPLPAYDLPDEWLREALWWDNTEYRMLARTAPLIELTAYDDHAEHVRVGLWSGDVRVAGWLVPFLPAHSILAIDNAQRAVIVTRDGDPRRLAGFVKDWDADPISYAELPHGNYRVTIDQEVDRAVRLMLRVSSIPTA
jgi:hypothetical protein